jgi:parallel beta-helix repeat protein
MSRVRWSSVVSAVLLASVLAISMAVPAMAGCLAPSGGERISEDTVMCGGNYTLTAPIIVTAPVTLDCDGSLLTSGMPITAIEIRGVDSVNITGCRITGFSTGILLQDSHGSIVAGNIFTRNQVAVGRIGSADSLVSPDVFDSDVQNVVDIAGSAAGGTGADTAPGNASAGPSGDEAKGMVVELQDNSTTAYDELKDRFSSYLNESSKYLTITRELIYNESSNTTTIRLTIIPSIRMSNFSYYEKVPKCMARYAKEIIPGGAGFTVVADDPLIMWDFSGLSQTRQLEYIVNRSVDDDCRKLLEGFGFATGFHYKTDYVPIMMGIAATIIIVFSVIKLKKA